ncbi:MAG: aldehyde dehydrogenase family protein, partial [Pseudomonadota bacterium]
IDAVIEAINATGYGLTFGLHTRIDDRVEAVTQRIRAGNIYVNRNQIGAIVGSQPFGGEGLSGTGPKAGGPHYVRRFLRPPCPGHAPVAGDAVSLDKAQLLLDAAQTDTQAQIEARDLPGPTGESNRWTTHPRGTILCLGPSAADARAQMEIAQAHGCAAVGIAPGLAGAGTLSGLLDRSALAELTGFAAVALWSDHADLSAARVALAARDGSLLPLIATDAMAEFCVIERHLCIDTTAAGGNASLLAAE